MRKWMVAATIVVAGVGMSGTALAGERTGSDRGGPSKDGTTPISEFQAGSICAFSGLNDDPDEEGLFAAGKVQNWGEIVVEAKDLNDPMFAGAGPGASELSGLIQTEGPGTNCRGYASADE
jgi:hypothetical protein